MQLIQDCVINESLKSIHQSTQKSRPVQERLNGACATSDPNLVHIHLNQSKLESRTKRHIFIEHLLSKGVANEQPKAESRLIAWIMCVSSCTAKRGLDVDWIAY